MRSAPPAVDVGLCSGQRERWMVAGVHALSATLLAAWACASWDMPRATLAAAFMLGGWLGWSALVPLQGGLRWDGQAWWHRPLGGPAVPLHRVDLMIDLGGWMLLRVPADGRLAFLRRQRWCAVTPGEAGSGWHGLRLALYHAPVHPPSPDAAQPGATVA